MIDSNKTPGTAGEPSNAGTVPNTSRRRWLQASISAAPVIMTVVSKPVLAATNQCVTPSGFSSANTSVPGGVNCVGFVPSYWVQSSHFSSWPAGYNPVAVVGPPAQPATLFCTVFNTAPCASPVAGQTLVQVLMFGGNVSQYVVAAVLNSASGFVPTSKLSMPTILEIWRQWFTTGFYSPRNGVNWDNNQIVQYLMTTMPN